MKTRFFAAMLLTVLSIAILSGCAAPIPPAPSQPGETIIAGPTVPLAPMPPDAVPAPVVPVPTEASATPTAPTETPRITREEAIAIALKNAGFTEDQVTRLRAEFDYDDRRLAYEVDFHQGGFEYDYEIHAETGAILSKDKDRED